MGGEQTAVLMYGPKKIFDIDLLCEKLNILSKDYKKEWVRGFLVEGVHDYEEPYDTDDEEGIHIVFDQEYQNEDKYRLLNEFLQSYGMTYVFDNNVCWEEPMIGIIVLDYNKFTEEKKEKVKDFCNKYNLESPTFFAGIIGEYE